LRGFAVERSETVVEKRLICRGHCRMRETKKNTLVNRNIDGKKNKWRGLVRHKRLPSATGTELEILPDRASDVRKGYRYWGGESELRRADV